MDVATIDFETYYDDVYSLKKITTEEYIRHKDFEVIGVSVKINDLPPRWHSGDDFSMRTFLASFDLGNKAVLAHHTAFDGSILKWIYDISPKLLLDTLSMSRPTMGMTVGGSLSALASALKVGTKGDEASSSRS